MRRRGFTALLGSGVTGWPLTARAQQPERMRRVGVFAHQNGPIGEGCIVNGYVTCRYQ